MSVTSDSNGNYWMTVRGSGVQICRPDGTICDLLPERVDLPSICQSTYRTRDGSIWIGGHSGLFQFYRNAFSHWPAPERIRHNPVNAIGEDHAAAMWFAGSDGVYLLHPNQAVTRTPNDNLNAVGISGWPDRRGALLASRGGVLFDQNSSRREILPIDPYENEEFYPHEFVEFIKTPRHLWLANSAGLFRVTDDGLVKDHPAEVGDADCDCLADGGGGTIYAGFNRGGVFRFQDGTWTSLGPDVWVDQVAVDPDGGVWILHDRSHLAWHSEGRWHSASVADLGLPSYFSFLCGEDGGLWFLGTKGGTIRLNREALQNQLRGDENVNLERQHFGLLDGLPSEHSQEGVLYAGAIFEDREDRIWVSTTRGAAVHDPSFWSESEQVMDGEQKVTIESVQIDDAPAALNGGGIHIRPDSYRLEINYVSVNLAHPEKVTYRYRLNGYDPDWIEVGNRRTAYYQNLPPGNYQFEVMAANLRVPSL